MKSYNHLWEIFVSDETIDKAINKAALGKKKRREVARYLKDP